MTSSAAILVSESWPYFLPKVLLPARFMPNADDVGIKVSAVAMLIESRAVRVSKVRSGQVRIRSDSFLTVLD